MRDHGGVSDALGPDSGPFFHGTRAEVRPGDLLEPGRIDEVLDWQPHSEEARRQGVEAIDD